MVDHAKFTETHEAASLKTADSTMALNSDVSFHDRSNLLKHENDSSGDSANSYLPKLDLVDEKENSKPSYPAVTLSLTFLHLTTFY